MQKRRLDNDGLKGAEDAMMVSFSHDEKGEAIWIGGRGFGDVFLGRVRLQDGSVGRVAIKVFREPLSDREVDEYKQTIRDLRAAGVRIPKMDFLKIGPVEDLGIEAGTWVQVSQYFGKVKPHGSGQRQTSKIRDTDHYPLNEEPLDMKLEAMEEWTKCANAGYFPALDLLEALEMKDGKMGAIAFDFDSMVGDKQAPSRLADKLLSNINEVASDDIEWDKMLEVAVKEANPDIVDFIRKELRRVRPGTRFEFEGYDPHA
jgi:hypothetical protein